MITKNDLDGVLVIYGALLRGSKKTSLKEPAVIWHLKRLAKIKKDEKEDITDDILRTIYPVSEPNISIKHYKNAFLNEYDKNNNTIEGQALHGFYKAIKASLSDIAHDGIGVDEYNSTNRNNGSLVGGGSADDSDYNQIYDQDDENSSRDLCCCRFFNRQSYQGHQKPLNDVVGEGTSTPMRR